jgi:hypothetical protein
MYENRPTLDGGHKKVKIGLNEKKNPVNKNQGWEPIHQKYKAKREHK